MVEILSLKEKICFMFMKGGKFAFGVDSCESGIVLQKWQLEA